MYGILGEEDSDAEMLMVLVRSLSNNVSVKCQKKGYDGFGDLLKKGARQLQSFRANGCSRFIVCVDADGPSPKQREHEVTRRVITPASIDQEFCVVVPVHTIEAWILADGAAVTQLFPSWSVQVVKENPESIAEPKRRIEEWSRKHNKRPRYDATTHNPRIAEHLNLKIVRKRCPSFEHFARFVTGFAVTSGQN
jgi:hypothetical protein